MTHRESAFTLVELSIVLVILGLLIGGVLTGQSLIRAAELRSITNDYARYVTATHTFRDKYFGLPGDIANATSFWGKDNTNCTGDTGTAATPGTCNGNGNGQINYATAASTNAELFQYWKQLALAGLIEGTYSGLNGPVGVSQDTVPGTNAPRGRISGTGWSITNSGPMGDAADFAGDYGIAYQYGVTVPGSRPYEKILKPEEAYNIDMKVDDGKPATGKLLARYWALCTNATANTDKAATYKLDQTGPQCSLWFIQQY